MKKKKRNWGKNRTEGVRSKGYMGFKCSAFSSLSLAQVMGLPMISNPLKLFLGADCGLRHRLTLRGELSSSRGRSQRERV